MSFRREIERACGLVCLWVTDYNHAMMALDEHPSLTVVVSDYDLGVGEPSGLELLIAVGMRWPEKKRLLISGLTSGHLVGQAYELGFDAIDKSLPQELLAAVCALAKPR